MTHPSDVPLRTKLGRDLEERIRDSVERLIKSPNERIAGRIDAYRDVLRVLSDGDDPPPMDFSTPPPPRSF